MRKVILLKSRYGETHRLERTGGSDSRQFIFVPTSMCRLGFSGDEEDSYDFIDPIGGPYIAVGKKLDSINKTVKSIKKAKYRGIIIEFE